MRVDHGIGQAGESLRLGSIAVCPASGVLAPVGGKKDADLLVVSRRGGEKVGVDDVGHNDKSFDVRRRGLDPARIDLERTAIRERHRLGDLAHPHAPRLAWICSAVPKNVRFTSAKPRRRRHVRQHGVD